MTTRTEQPRAPPMPTGNTAGRPVVALDAPSSVRSDVLVAVIYEQLGASMSGTCIVKQS